MAGQKTRQGLVCTCQQRQARSVDVPMATTEVADDNILVRKMKNALVTGSLAYW